jgi:hypothetical protein
MYFLSNLYSLRYPCYIRVIYCCKLYTSLRRSLTFAITVSAEYIASSLRYTIGGGTIFVLLSCIFFTI